MNNQLETATGWATEVFEGNLSESHTLGFKVFFTEKTVLSSYVDFLSQRCPALIVAEADEYSVEVTVADEK